MSKENHLDSLTGGERIAEISQILSAGLSRMLGRQSREKSLRTREFPLDSVEERSGHPTPVDRRSIDG
jgi:hypothetical protein